MIYQTLIVQRCEEGMTFTVVFVEAPNEEEALALSIEGREGILEATSTPCRPFRVLQ